MYRGGKRTYLKPALPAEEVSTRVGMLHMAVVGHGIVGLTRSRALSASIQRVTILERDQLGSGITYRAGVPHSSQPPLILPLNAQILEMLLPGFRQEPRQAGGSTFDTAAFGQQRWRVRGNTDVELTAFRSAPLEHATRKRLPAICNVNAPPGKSWSHRVQRPVTGRQVTLLAGPTTAQHALCAVHRPRARPRGAAPGRLTRGAPARPGPPHKHTQYGQIPE
jgi:hypothetical protein